jgi:hypothetical protein
MGFSCFEPTHFTVLQGMITGKKETSPQRQPKVPVEHLEVSEENHTATLSVDCQRSSRSLRIEPVR